MPYRQPSLRRRTWWPQHQDGADHQNDLHHGRSSHQ